MKFKELFINISYTFMSNLVSLVISIFITFLLPKILGVGDYGFYQLYLFYISYIGLLHIGWCDGIYLRYGGKDYDSLDKPLITGQLYSFVFLEALITIMGFVVIVINSNFTENHKSVVTYFVLNIIIMNVRTFLLFLLQTTNRIKEYSLITIIDRVIFLILVLFLIYFRIEEFKYYIISDIIAKLISLFYLILLLRDITFNFKKVKYSFRESLENIFSGMNLLFAYISGLLIIGFVRIGIQNKWGIEVFGNVSLTLSISNMLMVFINAISLSLFPLIKKLDREKYSETYIQFRNFILPIMTVLLITYYPIIFLLSKWLPDYSKGLSFMGLVFPIVLFESKFNLLILTYLKAIRKEKYIFLVNFIVAIVSGILSIVTIKVFGNLTFTVLSITMLMMLKCFLSEYFLNKELKIDLNRNYFLDVFTTFVFIYSAWVLDLKMGLFIYLLYIFIYLIIQRNSIKESLNFFLKERQN